MTNTLTIELEVSPHSVQLDVDAAAVPLPAVADSVAAALGGEFPVLMVPSGTAGPRGAQGDPGPAGPPGAPGEDGSVWWGGDGAPGTVIGAAPGDWYVDNLTGQTYRLGD